jgi:hypothetical protein
MNLFKKLKNKTVAIRAESTGGSLAHSASRPTSKPGAAHGCWQCMAGNAATRHGAAHAVHEQRRWSMADGASARRRGSERRQLRQRGDDDEGDAVRLLQTMASASSGARCSGRRRSGQKEWRCSTWTGSSTASGVLCKKRRRE